MKPLAIVIPAYRTRFLVQALESLAAQTNRHFTVYVGDDASPDDVGSVCADWSDRLDLHHVRFDTNLGGHDLVAQWMRCIALAKEPWVWLFSDDDLMDPGCVQAWHDAVGRHPGVDLFHFDVLRIDAEGRLLQKEPTFPDRLTARMFLQGRLLGRLASFAPDYVFRRAALENVAGFQSFPLAWCSDDATWIKLSSRGGGIHAIRGPSVRWRYSGSNISSSGNVGLARQKAEAALQFLEWLDAQLSLLPVEPGDPDDGALFRDARYWFYQQVSALGLRFTGLHWWSMAVRLGRLKHHSVAGTLLRMARSDWALRKQSMTSGA